MVSHSIKNRISPM